MYMTKEKELIILTRLQLNPEEEITRKVMSAVTDPNRIRKDDLGNPDVCMVAYYHNLFSSEKEYEEVCKECRAAYGVCAV